MFMGFKHCIHFREDEWKKLHNSLIKNYLDRRKCGRNLFWIMLILFNKGSEEINKVTDGENVEMEKVFLFNIDRASRRRKIKCALNLIVEKLVGKFMKGRIFD